MDAFDLITQMDKNPVLRNSMIELAKEVLEADGYDWDRWSSFDVDDWGDSVGGAVYSTLATEVCSANPAGRALTQVLLDRIDWFEVGRHYFNLVVEKYGKTEG